MAADLRALEARLHMHRSSEMTRVAARGNGRGGLPTVRGGVAGRERPPGFFVLLWRALQCRFMRGVRMCMMSVLIMVMALVGLVWLVLRMNGPVPIDWATPWVAGAVADNFGNRFKVDIGGTVLKLDEHGWPAIRNRAITMRDNDGTVIASAPEAEVRVSRASLLNGRLRAQRLNLVGAELAVRVEADGQVTMSTGGEPRPVAVTSAPATRGFQPAGATLATNGSGTADSSRSLQEALAAFLAWVDSLSALGIDGGELTEVGLKSGNLVVDDKRNGQQSRFENIRLSLTRPDAGHLKFELASEDADHPWLVKASIKPGDNGARMVDLEASKVMLKDLLLAMRVDGGQIDSDASMSAKLRAEFAADGSPHTASGRIILGPGSFVDTGDPAAKITIDHAQADIDWNAEQRLLTVPFEVRSGGTRLTLTAQAEAPSDPGGCWALNLSSSGLTVLAPVNAADQPVVLNRVSVRSRIDPVAKQFNVEYAEIAGKGISVAMAGNLDYATPDPRLKVHLATRKLPLAAFKQIWPSVVTPPVREWIIERSSGGMIEQGDIVTNAPISTLRSGGPPVPDDGLSMQFTTSGVTVHPFDNLPDIRDADIVSTTKGRNTTVKLGRATIQMPSGRKLAMSNGSFEVADTSVRHPPAKVRAKVDGPMASAAELLSMDRLKEAAGFPIDPAGTRGNMAATVNLGMSLGQEDITSTITYAIAADVTNFSADRFFMSQKVEAQTLHATASNQGFQITKSDVRVGGAPATVEMRRGSGESDAEVHLTGTLDDAARTRFGFDANGAIAGPVGVKIGGRVAMGGDADSRLTVEADFAQARFDNVVPGWSKAPKTPAKATFTYVGRGKQAKLDDIAFDGNGASIRGTVDLDQNGDFAAGTFPMFGLAEGDKATLQLERTPDNAYKATIRGDTFDGRNFIKTAMSGGPEPKQRRPAIDFDIDAKLNAIAGFKGELLRNLDLHVTRRGGVIRNFAANARFAGDGVLQGELRGKSGSQQNLYLESSDAGALFRFSDVYSRMYGGQMWIMMDPPTHDGAKKNGLIEVQNFMIRGESALDGIAANAPSGGGGGVPFWRMHVDFTREPGRMTIQKGKVKGPTVGGSIDGVMDYAANELHLRGTFVPLYGMNTALGEIPLFGDLLGGDRGIIGSVNYEVVGSPGTPVFRVNPISALMPGFTKQLLEFPATSDRFPPGVARDR